MEQNGIQTVLQTEYGVGNALRISSEALLANMRAVQKRNDLPQTDNLVGDQFSIKMETETGKAYVYTRTILKQSGRAQDFLNNSQMFMEQATNIILNVRRSLAVDGISYRKLYGEEYYAQEIFDSAELTANLDRNAAPVEHSVYDLYCL